MNPRLLTGVILVLAGAGLGIGSAFLMGTPELKLLVPFFLSMYPVSILFVLLGLWQVAQSEEPAQIAVSKE